MTFRRSRSRPASHCLSARDRSRTSAEIPMGSGVSRQVENLAHLGAVGKVKDLQRDAAGELTFRALISDQRARQPKQVQGDVALDRAFERETAVGRVETPPRHARIAVVVSAPGLKKDPPGRAAQDDPGLLA